MKILLIISLFQPEPNHLKGLAYTRQVARQGHSVQVLTGFPNYPDGKSLQRLQSEMAYAGINGWY
jgi:colanic acid biosynthesis glycosyl transferase WcaI